MGVLSQIDTTTRQIGRRSDTSARARQMVAIEVPTSLVGRHLVQTSTDTTAVEARWCEQENQMEQHEYPSQSLYRITHQLRLLMEALGSRHGGTTKLLNSPLMTRNIQACFWMPDQGLVGIKNLRDDRMIVGFRSHHLSPKTRSAF